MPGKFNGRLRCLGILSAVAACAGAEPGGTHTVTDSTGIAIVTSTAADWGDHSPRIDSTPLVRLGSDEAGPYQFSFVGRGLLLDAGGFAVVEQSTSEVRFFDAEGRHDHTFGRRGRGPGEFQVISALFRYPGDSLAAYDQSQRRLTLFAVAGGEPRVVRSQQQGNRDAFGMLGGGQLLLYNPGSGYRPGVPPGLQWDTSDVDVLDPADGAVRTIARLPSRQQYVLPNGDTRPFTPAHYALKAATTDGFYWATSDRYDIRYFAGDGALQRILRRPVEPRPVERAMVEAWINANLEDRRRYEGPDAVARYREEFAKMPVGDKVPLFDERAFVDGDGRLWVGEAIWPALRGAPRRWSVFAPDGAWLGDVEAPDNFLVLDVRQDRVLGVSQAGGEAPYVEVHRLLRR
jgi:hypothetical protein